MDLAKNKSSQTSCTWRSTWNYGIWNCGFECYLLKITTSNSVRPLRYGSAKMDQNLHDVCDTSPNDTSLCLTGYFDCSEIFGPLEFEESTVKIPTKFDGKYKACSSQLDSERTFLHSANMTTVKSLEKLWRTRSDAKWASYKDKGQIQVSPWLSTSSQLSTKAVVTVSPLELPNNAWKYKALILYLGLHTLWTSKLQQMWLSCMVTCKKGRCRTNCLQITF